MTMSHARPNIKMRKHLQERHQDMTADIVEFIEASTNTIAGYFTLQSGWLKENLCVIYKLAAEVDTCEGSEDELLGLVGLSLWDKMINIEAQGKGMMEKIEMMSQSGVGADSLMQDGTEGEDLKAISVKVDATESKLIKVEDKIDEVKGEMKDMKVMMSHLIEQNKKLMEVLDRSD